MRNKVKCLAVCFACLMSLSVFTACGGGEKIEDYPDAKFVINYDMEISRELASKAETQLALTISESYYIKSMPEDKEENKEARERHIAMIDAVSFPVEKVVYKKGGVTHEDILKVIPESRKIVVVETSGSVIKELAESTVNGLLNAAEKDPKPEKIFMFTGIAFVFDKNAAVGKQIIDTGMLNKTQLDINKRYTIAVNNELADRLIEKYSKVDTKIIREIGSEIEIFESYVKDNNGLSAVSSRFMSKSERDTPTIVVIVLIVLGVLAIVGAIIAYFVMKDKQKKARKKRNNQPRIDV